jgi:hypothetical protein
MSESNKPTDIKTKNKNSSNKPTDIKTKNKNSSNKPTDNKNNIIKPSNQKQIKKLLNVLERRKPQLNNLVMRFILVILLIIIFFISLDLYLYNYKPIVLSKFQYSYYKKGVNVPPGITSSGNKGSGVGKDFIAAEKLSKCAAGFCALEKSTGLKRCPDGNYELVYNTDLEVCTRKEFCDDDFLTYAVLIDGTTSKDGKCDPGVPCRCTFEKKCNSGIISPFEVVFGSNFDPSQNNFSIGQFPNYDTQYGYDAVLLKNPSTEFCDINPAFTSRLTNGCDFQNSVRDKLDCQNVTSVIPVSNAPGSSNLAGVLYASPIGTGGPGLRGTDVKKGDRSFKSFKYVNNESKEGAYLLNSLDSPGYLLFSNENDGTIPVTKKRSELIRYDRIDKDDSNTITVSGIVHLESSPASSLYGTLGFGMDWSSYINDETGGAGGGGQFTGLCTSITSYDLLPVNCSIATDGPNYKNMLLCTQKDRQPCKQGTLAYHFDKIRGTNTTTNGSLTDEAFSRNFCQQRSNSSPTQTTYSYLQDPAFYTMSCYLGNGCNDTKLALNNETGLKAAAGKYYPDVDVGGIKGQWEVTTSSYPQLRLSNLPEGSLINEESIEPGDFWSIKSSSEVLSCNKESKQGTSTIFVGSLLALNSYIGTGDINENVRPGISVSVGGVSAKYNVVNCKYNSSNQFTMGVSPNLVFDIPKNTPITVGPIDMQSRNGFVYYGIVTRPVSQSGNGLEGIKDTQQLTLSDIDGNNISLQPIEEDFNIVIFKQFSFSGGNYNTIIYDDNNVKRRVYSGSSTSPIYGSAGLDDNKIAPLIPPQNISNIFLNQADIGFVDITNTAASFQGDNEPFKIPLSMYYPVWNPVTFQQECIKCKPSLVAYPELGLEENIEKIVIQYCGRDFLNYEYDVFSDSFVFTSVSQLDTTKYNTTRIFYLKEPNPNLQVGDYVMGFNLQFPVEVLNSSGTSATYSQSNGDGNNLTLIPQLTYYGQTNPKKIYGFEESENTNFVIPANSNNRNSVTVKDNGKLYVKLEANGSNFVIDTDKSSNASGYSFGKIYRPSNPKDGKSKNFGFYLTPITTVTDISSDKKTITTSVQVSSELKTTNPVGYSDQIQFCRIGDGLEIDLVQDLGTNIPTTGEGQVIRINKITDGRITSIVVVDGGKNFLQNTLPIVAVGNYDYYIT